MKQDLWHSKNFFYPPIRMLCQGCALLCLALSFVTMAVSIPQCVVKSDRLWTMTGSLKTIVIKHCILSTSINLELDEEIMKPEKATKTPRNSGLDPSTMKMKQWHQGQDRLSDKSLWQMPSDRV